MPDNVQVVRDLFAAYKRGDIDAILNGLTEDVTWEMPGPPHVPAAGRRFGPGQVEDFFGTLRTTIDRLVVEPREFIAQGDKVAVIGHSAGRAKSTGREYVTDFVMVFTMRGGKVAEFREYLDTAALGAAFDTGESKLGGVPGNP